ncbi:DUF3558 domain-containing protein [Streptomyces sp. NPDC058001]|uniref:DUF3558 domain-containing protein n=1 Tax=Streptomyces sp. NPDC058001 TaxID=3346300 RepID=UPI0036E22EEE
MSPHRGERRFSGALLASMPHLFLLSLLFPLFLVLGCTSSSPSTTADKPAAPSAEPAQVAEALETYATAPCNLLGSDEMAAYGVTGEPRQLTFHEGTSPACYWQVPPDRILGWFIDLPAKVRSETAKKAGARQIKVAGYPAVRHSDKKSCTLDVTLDREHSFRSALVRVEPDAPGDPCKAATSFAELIVTRLQQPIKSAESTG